MWPWSHWILSLSFVTTYKFVRHLHQPAKWLNFVFFLWFSPALNLFSWLELFGQMTFVEGLAVNWNISVSNNGSYAFSTMTENNRYYFPWNVLSHCTLFTAHHTGCSCCSCTITSIKCCTFYFRKRSREDDSCEFMPLSKRINNLHINNNLGSSNSVRIPESSHVNGINTDNGISSPSSSSDSERRPSYDPGVNSSQSSYYYDNKLLFELHLERVQRTGQQFPFWM